MDAAVSHKTYTATLLLAIFFGFAGFHRFYRGKVGTGLLYFISFGLLGMGWLIDIISVAAGNFTDKSGAWIKLSPLATSEAGGANEGAAEKPLYTRWWFITIAALVVLGIISSLSDGDDDQGGSSTMQSEVVEDQGEEGPELESAPDSGPEPEPDPAPSAEPEPEYPDGTIGQTNARESAEVYLSYSSFSRHGLIEQLEFEGYSTDEATYAVDVLRVDWSEQAVGSAPAYLDYSAFSRTGLIDQLEFEGFSTDEATYGVDKLGADWKEQAALSAASYLEFSSFSRQGLIDQLIFERCTREEAESGVAQVGY